MKFKIQSLLIALFLCSTLSYAQLSETLPIIPHPQEFQIGDGEFVLTDKMQVFSENESLRNSVSLLNFQLEKLYGIQLKPILRSENSTKIKLIHDPKVEPESYQLQVDPNSIQIVGGEAGVFYGLQSLLQLIKEEDGKLKIASVDIKDKPEFGYRGLMIDVSRHFRSLDEMKEIVDLMAHFKLNRLHWHLTDDQGWRLEIKKYPKLTQQAAWRDSTIIGQYGDFKPFIYDGKPHGGFYTQSEARELVAYAAKRHITVIPEIELPGHTSAVLAAYPEFGSFDVVNGVPLKGNIDAKRENGNPYNNEILGFVPGYWGILYNIFGPKEQTFQFLEDVLTEVMEIFPSKYIHIGGDEVPKDHWITSSLAQEVIKREKLKDEHELQSYFIKRIEKFLNSKGRNLIGWDEILEGGLAPNATVMSWRGEAGGIAAAKMGHDVIMTPNSHMYFDHGQGKQSEEPLFICCYLPLEKVYSYHPRPKDLTTDQQKHVLGVQANMWTEYVPSNEKIQYMIFPRLLALSEVAWMPKEKKEYDQFAKTRLPESLNRLEKLGVNFRIPEAQVEISTNGSKKEVKLTSSVSGSKIYYTFDGHLADRSSHLYQDKIDMPIVGSGQNPLKLNYIIVTPGNRQSGMYSIVID
ncbi:beta-N-acetylhexosaminidase [Belliella kenyensis]|uniref:beta-N-acetylhexosaminidase n=1 Tax=Belliella kenyensis TaxID=1472724 RepID=A0ABV8EKU4_9BACT|nr:family 20 glycosylhydrolase [Belliella kenyensis]MCH7400275.1 family 20 glycosylhydrolase [Belliella kenyensis]MDN3604707.1 family 20 glycosylhydrolase [Belliella kenyensis]